MTVADVSLMTVGLPVTSVERSVTVTIGVCTTDIGGCICSNCFSKCH